MIVETYAGIDLHKEFSYVTVLDKEGQRLASSKIVNDPEKLTEFFNNVSCSRAVIEATFAWGWMADFLAERGIKVILAHPQRVKAIASARIKTDKIDSRVLADLDRANLIPEAYLAGKREREIRDLLRLRLSLVYLSSSIKRRIHAVLHKHNLRWEGADLFGKSGRAFLSTVIKERENITGEYVSLELTQYLGSLDELKERVIKVSQTIREIALKDETASFLQALPGLGYFSALILSAELGNIERFPSAKNVCSYAGLTASTYQSGNSTRHGRIKPGNKYVRWILIEAVPKAVKKDHVLKEFYERVALKKGHPKAKVATARKMLSQIYFSLKAKRYFVTGQGYPGFFSGRPSLPVTMNRVA